VLTYITKELDDLSPKDMALFFRATFGRRLLFTFGEFYGIKKPKLPKKYQYVKPGSEEHNQFYSSKNNRPPDLLDYNKEVNEK
jgi:hypothetical protein